jgi:hypothetical protein
VWGYLVIDIEPAVRAYTRAGTRISVHLRGLMLVSPTLAMAETGNPAASSDPASTSKPVPKEKAKGANPEDSIDSV